MKRRNSSRPSAATSEFLLPQPSAEGVAKMRRLYLSRTGKPLTEGEARDILARLMRFQYLNVLNNAPCDMASTPESPTTTES